MCENFCNTENVKQMDINRNKSNTDYQSDIIYNYNWDFRTLWF